MKKYIVLICCIGMLFLISLIYKPSTKEAAEDAKPDARLIASVRYMCDGGKTITATYYKGEASEVPAPGNPPIPTGSVEVAMDSNESELLQQTISGSGIRYANEDESFVFWSKGDSALIMRNNSMDLNYTNCMAQK
jgi:membrane-bound inhibitor of C-type lysozyme